MVLAVLFLFGAAAMLLWNWLLPTIVGLPEITFLQAVGLLALSRILFGGIGGMGRMAGGGTMRDFGDHINPFREKWMNMSEEERKDFIFKHHAQHHGGGLFGGRGGSSPSDNGKDNK
jgi:hypothetical protein